MGFFHALWAFAGWLWAALHDPSPLHYLAWFICAGLFLLLSPILGPVIGGLVGLVVGLFGRELPRFTLFQGPPPLAGVPYVIDGDTVIIGTRHIRVQGIDAPEMGQMVHLYGDAEPAIDAGDLARAFLLKLIDSRSITAKLHGADVYGRDLGIIRRGDYDLGYAMVQAGWAIATQEGPHSYHVAERMARQNEFGVWAARDFQDPALWRRAHPDAHLHHGAEAPHTA